MITRTGRHAILALAALARMKGGYGGAAGVAGRIGAPRNYLGKLLQTLARAGLVESLRGMGGGFRLARDPREITLYDVVEPIEHVSRWNGCFLGRKKCSDGNACAVHGRWSRARDAYFGLLRNTTIADVAREDG